MIIVLSMDQRFVTTIVSTGGTKRNENTDSRHQHDIVEVMLAALAHQPDVALADADQFISHKENEAFTQCESHNAGCTFEPHGKPQDACVVPLRGRATQVAKVTVRELGTFRHALPNGC